MTANDNLTPRERLAKIVAEETGGGRRIVRFLVQVTEGDLHSEGFQPCHRMDSAKELVKIGLTEFEDYIQANSTPRKPRARKTSRPDADISPEIAEAREQLAEYARELTQDGRTVIKLYSEVMEGVREDEGFKPHHRIAAARELIKRGFDETVTPVPEVRPETDSTVVPAKAGTHTPEPTTDNSQLKIDNEEPTDYLAIVKSVVESLDPADYEEEEEKDLGYKPDLSMWDIIAAQPTPVITEEQARIEYAKIREEIETRRQWKESEVEIPDPPEGLTRYDDP